MDATTHDATRNWLLPERSQPPLIGELERRIDEALATARASEAAVMTVGAAALDAAEQARRAAELAERASAMVAGRGPEAPAVTPAVATEVPPTPPTRGPAAGDASLGDFSERADRLVARLRRLQRIPLAAPAASDAAGRPQYGH
jgi:hypothetical protein